MNKWSLRLITLGMVLPLGFFAWASLNRPITLVKVSGNLTVEERTVIGERLSTSLEKNLLDVNLETIKNGLEVISWIKDASIRRVWPSELEVHVTREQPVAKWGDNGYLTAQGKVITLKASSGSISGLPIFNCHSASPTEAIALYRLMNDALISSNGHIISLTQSELGDWAADLSFDSYLGPRVILGSDHLVDRMKRFLLVYSHVGIDQFSRVGYVDARYSSGVAVGWDRQIAVGKIGGKYGFRK